MPDLSIIKDVNIKDNIYTFNDGVEVNFFNSNRAVVKFTPMGLAVNDLYRFLAGNIFDVIITDTERFATKASEYLLQIDPTLKVKRSESVKTDKDLNVLVFLHLSKYPNHITKDWQDKKEESGLPYAGPKNRTYPWGWGKGEKGSNYYLNQPVEESKKSEEKEIAEMYGYKKSSFEVNKVPGSLVKEVEEKSLPTLRNLIEDYKAGLKSIVPVKVDVEKKYLTAENQLVINHIRDFLLDVTHDNVKDKDSTKKKGFIDYNNPYRYKKNANMIELIEKILKEKGKSEEEVKRLIDTYVEINQYLEDEIGPQEVEVSR